MHLGRGQLLVSALVVLVIEALPVRAATPESVPATLLENHGAFPPGWHSYQLPGAACTVGSSWHLDSEPDCHPSGVPASPSIRWGTNLPDLCSSYSDRSVTDVLASPSVDLSSCLYGLDLELSYYLDYQEGSQFDRARVEIDAPPFSSVLAHNGNGGGLQSPSCAGGTNPGTAEGLFNLSFWLPLWDDLDPFLTADAMELHFVGEVSDGVNNSGLGFLFDDLTVACNARPPTAPWVVESFETDSAGGPPGLPDLGTADYFQGSFTVVAVGGGLQLEASNEPGMNADWGYYSLAEPLPSSPLVEYDVSVDGASTLTGDAGFLQRLQLGFGGDLFLRLEWGADGKLRLGIQATGLPPEQVVSSFSWFEDSAYKVVWWIDLPERTVTVRVNGEALVTGHALPAAFATSSLVALDFRISTGSLATVRVDDIRIAELPIFADGFESGETSSWSSASR